MKTKLVVFLLLVTTILASCTIYADNKNNNISNDDVHQDNYVLLYGENYKEENTLVNQEYLAGMCYLFWERQNEINYREALKAIKNLGVKSLRTWMHFKYFMSDPYTIDEEKTKLMHDYLSEAIDLGFQIIGMNHTSYHKDGYFSIGKVERLHLDDPNSEYNEWLKDYEQSWYTLVSEFPEVSYWEIDNEINNPDFMYINGAKDDVLNLEEMAHISADMLYYGSLGIHRANPNANTIMGGLVDSHGLGNGCYYNDVYVGNMKQFLEMLYDVIDSGEHHSLYYDDFFQIAAWHPYYYTKTADDYFVAENNAIYEIIKNREGKDKKVFLTEFGWNDLNTNGKSGDFITDLYTVLRTKMPYVESLHYFIMFDIEHENYNGMFKDPKLGGAVKDNAIAYQKVNGGSGSLEFDFYKK